MFRSASIGMRAVTISAGSSSIIAAACCHFQATGGGEVDLVAAVLYVVATDHAKVRQRQGVLVPADRLQVRPARLRRDGPHQDDRQVRISQIAPAVSTQRTNPSP